jgi:hypothetical protein
MRKGRVYGTLIVELERHRPIDLLPDRSAATLAQWLHDRPSVELITRDRRTEYIRAMTEAAPEATQVTDRWHLLANLRDAVERLLRRLHRRLWLVAKGQGYSGLPRPPQRRTATELAARQADHKGRLERYEAIQALVAQGVSYREIARRLHLSWPTVQRYAQSEEAPSPRSRRPLPSLLDPYLTHLHQRWQEGETNASQLWREIVEQGYRGGYRLLASAGSSNFADTRHPPHRIDTVPQRRLVLPAPAENHDQLVTQPRLTCQHPDNLPGSWSVPQITSTRRRQTS